MLEKLQESLSFSSFCLTGLLIDFFMYTEDFFSTSTILVRSELQNKSIYVTSNVENFLLLFVSQFVLILWEAKFEPKFD